MDLPVPFSLRDLFLAGAIPALLMILSLSVYSVWVTKDLSLVREQFDGAEVLIQFQELRWDIPLPFIVLGGIYSGFFAVSEAAAVTSAYVVLVYVFVKKEVNLSSVPRIVKESMMMVGGILLILGVSLAFTNYLIDAEVPQALSLIHI